MRLSIAGGEAAAGNAITLARRWAEVTSPQVDGTVVSFRLPQADRHAVRLLHELDAAGIVLEGFAIERPTLDDVFLTLTGRTLRDEAA